MATAVLITSGIGLAATSNAAEAGSDCTLVVPANPLTAQGLATPYQLVGCHEANPDTAAFVQATVADPATGKLAVYNPLVVDQGTEPAQPPVVPQLPAGGVVGIWFGFNGDNLTLKDSNGSLTQGRCVNGANGSIFGQFAYCNAPAFFSAANAAIGAGRITVPALGTATNGKPCMTTRDFGMVDQDQSDNVTTTYLFLADGTTAQNTAANQKALAAKGAKVQTNGSDEGLVDNFLNPALGCAAMTAPDLADPGRQVTSLALNELMAAADQRAPIALVPPNDPMTQVDAKASIDKTNLYRAGVDQPRVNQATDTPKAYCRNLVDGGVARTRDDAALTKAFRSPNAAAASNLFTFLAQRLNQAITLLGCENLLGIKNPVTVVTDAAGVAVDARFTVVPPPPPSPSASPSASASRSASASPSASATSTAPPPPSASASASRPAPSRTATPPVKPSPSQPVAPPMAPANPQPRTSSPTAQGTAATGTGATGTGTGAGATGTGTGAGSGTGPATGGAGNGTTTTGGGTANVPPPPPPPAGPAAAGAATVPASDPTPALTLGPVPAKAGTPNAAMHNAGNSMPPLKMLGLGLLTVGIVLGGGFWIRSLLARRQRSVALGF